MDKERYNQRDSETARWAGEHAERCFWKSEPVYCRRRLQHNHFHSLLALLLLCCLRSQLQSDLCLVGEVKGQLQPHSSTMLQKKERNDFSDFFGGMIPKRPKRPSRWIFLNHLRIHVQKETAPLQTKPGRPARYPRPSGCQCNLLLTKKPGGSSKNTQPKGLYETWSFSELHKPSL